MRDKMNVAVLGLGGMGGTHVQAAKASEHVDDITGYEPDPDRAKSRGEELGIKATSDLSAIISDPGIKLIYIASINEVHSEQTIAALEAGKAVLCEKPMGISIEEARRMIDAEKRTGQFLQIGFELHYSKMYTQVRDWIDQGLIGSPVNCHCRYYCSEFHMKDTWRSRSEGTLIGEKLSHYLDLQRWWLGGKVDEVFSMSAPNVVHYFNHPDNHQISMRFDNGAISNLNFIMHLGETDHKDPLLEMLEKQSDDGHALQYILYGDQGAIETDVFRRRIRRWAFRDGPKQLESEIVETITFDKSEDQIWFHNTHGQNVRVAELVAEGKQPEVPAEDAFETMRVCFGAELSEKEGRPVKTREL